MPDRMVLRRWRGAPRTIIALLIDQPEAGRGHDVNSYEHVGQHGGASYQGVISQTTPVDAAEPDAHALLCELRSLGYAPHIMQRRPRGSLLSLEA